jgi:methanogenic corrinoid protein MtbC1
LVSLVTAREEAKAIAFIEGLHAGGIPVEMLYLDLLAPVARQLGQMWTDDDCDFTDVTIGLFLLQNALRELGAAFQSDLATDAMAPRALLVPLPGEQHTFGLSMVFDFFRRAGWNAWSGPIDSDAVLADMVQNSWFDVVGFSLACDEQLDDARRAIRLVRKQSRNPNVAVMVGGPGFAINPALAALVGADGTAIDGLQAVQQARALVTLATSRR